MGLKQLGCSSLSSTTELAFALRTQGKLVEAESYFREVLARTQLGESHRSTLSAMNNLAHLLTIGTSLWPKDIFAKQCIVKLHLQTLTITNNLGNLLRDQSKLEEAKYIFSRLRRQQLGDVHPDTLASPSTILAHCSRVKVTL